MVSENRYEQCVNDYIASERYNYMYNDKLWGSFEKVLKQTSLADELSFHLSLDQLQVVLLFIPVNH